MRSTSTITHSYTQIPTENHLREYMTAASAQAEAQSAVDENEDDSNSLAMPPQPKRTTITVAHRLSSVVHCDKIIVLQRGRVVEQGTHEELLQLPNGVYRNMWDVQNNFAQQQEQLQNNPNGSFVDMDEGPSFSGRVVKNSGGSNVGNVNTSNLYAL